MASVATTTKAPVLLVVDDDREMRSLLCDEFASAGYQVREAMDGKEACLAVRQAIPDLIVTDLRMPAGDVDYIGRLRAIAPRCPIVVMTAFGNPLTRAAALQAGASAYVNKPVRMGELKACVKQLLLNQQSTLEGE